MKLPVSWLKEWVAISAVGVEEIAKRLTFSGFEVEGTENVAGETVLEINVTPNRGDALSVRGLAREVGALFGAPWKAPYKTLSLKSTPKSAVSVSVAKPKLCPRYALAVIDGVRIGPGPEWLSSRLAQVGIRSVNNVVDVTNFVLMELGQPLHAFDRAKLRGGKIAVRTARPDEVLKTLDGVERKLKADDLVIADAEGAVALAGVMGGASSEVTVSTTAIALESAFFQPSAIRRASRRLGLSSESSHRFERRVDPEAVFEALCRAAQLIVEVAGGQVSSVSDLYKEKQKPASVALNPKVVGDVLGGDWKDTEVRFLLQKLGFKVGGSAKAWKVTAPSYRGDVSRDVDLIEEVARLSGLERVPEKFPALSRPVPAGADLSRERTVKSLLADLGFRETIHYSFVAPELASVLGEEGGATLANPLSREQSVLRPSLLPSLLAAASHHARHKMDTFRAFELRSVFEATGARPGEKKRLSGVLMGARLLSHWSGGVQATDFYDLKGSVERILAAFSQDHPPAFARSAVSYLHPGQQASVLIEDRPVGILGEVHPDVLKRLDLRKTVYAFDLDWDALAALPTPAPRFADYPRTPVVERDLAVVVDEGVEAGRIVDFIAKQDSVISDARVFDLYRGDQVTAGKKSLAFSIRMSQAGRTLTDEEVNAVFQRVINGVKNEFQAEVR
ncbi:MAG TPA: phenylalanine--tRNA ligase subunit beta [bacterium]|nr:phenylalanine--tRNA ligase subunit beta [bacterium]